MATLIENVLDQNNILNVQSIFYRNWLARIAIYYCFTLEGMYTGVWGRYLPIIQDKLGLSDALLGTSVLFYYLGSVMATPLVAILLRRFGSRTVTILGAWSYIISLPFVGLCNSFGILTALTLLFGIACGLMDISMNNSAILTEIVAGHPLLGSFHGSYSIAAAVSSVIGGVLIQNNYGTFDAFAIVSVVATAFSLATCAHMYNYSQEKFLTDLQKNEVLKLHNMYQSVDIEDTMAVSRDSASRPNKRIFSDDSSKDGEESKKDALMVPYPSPSSSSETVYVTADMLFGQSRANNTAPSLEGKAHNMDSPLLAGIDNSADDRNRMSSSDTRLWSSWKIISTYSALGFLAAFGESSIVTWSVVFFDRDIKASTVVKSLGFTSFMVCMALGRFICDYLRRTVGRRLMMRIGGFLASGGLILVALSVDLPYPAAFACIGFSLTGTGLSTIIPTVFSSAGHLPGVHAGTAVAIVGGFTYTGSIISSPLVGVLSDSFNSLRYALLCDGILLALIVPLSFGMLNELPSPLYNNSQS